MNVHIVHLCEKVPLALLFRKFAPKNAACCAFYPIYSASFACLAKPQVFTDKMLVHGDRLRFCGTDEKEKRFHVKHCYRRLSGL